MYKKQALENIIQITDSQNGCFKIGKNPKNITKNIFTTKIFCSVVIGEDNLSMETVLYISSGAHTSHSPQTVAGVATL